MRLPNTHVDANLHPTKEEVAILHQEDIIDSVCTAIELAIRRRYPGCAVAHHKHGEASAAGPTRQQWLPAF